MKTYGKLIPAVAAALLGAALVAAPARAADEKKDSVLHTEMKAMGTAVKALKKTVKDPAKKDESLKLVAELRKQTTACKAEVPTVVAKAPEAEKAKLTAGYTKMLDQVLGELDKLEAGIKDGKADAVQDALKALKTLEDEGHEKYNP
ncbi:MAG TPA: cytochrome b562 [Humisphaera sp.]